MIVDRLHTRRYFQVCTTLAVLCMQQIFARDSYENLEDFFQRRKFKSGGNNGLEEGEMDNTTMITGDFHDLLDIMIKVRDKDLEKKCGGHKDCDLPVPPKIIDRITVKKAKPLLHLNVTPYTFDFPLDLPLHDVKTAMVMLSKRVMRIRDFRGEDDFTHLASLGASDSLTEGAVASHFGLVDDPVLSAVPCTKTEGPDECLPNASFRTYGGMCNNLKHKLWGSSSIALRRLVGSAYADNVGSPRGKRDSASTHCGPKLSEEAQQQNCDDVLPSDMLPNPRRVSREFHHDTTTVDQKFTSLFVYFGQLLTHEVTLTPTERGNCCESTSDEAQKCFDIFIPTCTHAPPETKNEYTHGNTSIKDICLKIPRSKNHCDNPDRREQTNGLSAFIDASGIYNINEAKNAELRTHGDGLMRVSEGNLLPKTNQDRYRGGEARLSENPLVATLQTLFVREHNRLARDIKLFRPEMDDEGIFQEARRILIAEYQSIVFNQYLEVLLGKENADLGLTPSVSQDFYDETVNPGIFNEFATAAFRHGHSGVPTYFQERDVETGNVKNHSLSEGFFRLDTFYKDNMEGLLNGMLFQPGGSIDRFFTDELTEGLFNFRADLVAANIQRGRDHGIAPYNDYRKHCDLPSACNWDEPPEEISESDWELLRRLYTSPGHIDLFVGGLAEKPQGGGSLGKTFMCIVMQQFLSIKFGDRFFFSHQEADIARPFSREEVMKLNSRTLGDLICDNTNISKVKENVFLLDSPLRSCQNRTRLNAKGFL